ncbi:MAG: glycosyltransferase family 2 protein [Roseicyclus sp.]
MTNQAAQTRRLLVIVPAYNEEETIAQTLQGIWSVTDELKTRGVALSVCVVNDGSSDRTFERAQAAGADIIVTHRTNRGLGAAVRTGLMHAREDGFDLVVKFDADLQHDPRDIPGLLEPVLAGRADVVYGDRFGQISYRMPLIRRTGNLVFSRLMRALTGWPVTDSQPGIFAVNRSYIENAYLPGSYNYTQQVLLDARALGLRFAQVPVHFDARRHGRSFVSLKYPYRVLYQMLIIIASNKPMTIFFPIGLFFLVLAVTIGGVQMAQWMAGINDKPIQNVNLVMISFVFGAQVVLFGLLAELIVQSRQARGPQRDVAHVHYAARPEERAIAAKR